MEEEELSITAMDRQFALFTVDFVPLSKVSVSV